MTNVLVVDDNPLDRRVAGECVLQSGMTPVYANSGTEALTIIRDSAPDIVLTDLDMPELDGLELVRRIQVQEESLPIIIMTAKGSEEIAAEALKSGAASYVPKRSLSTELDSALRIVCGAAQARQRRESVFRLLRSSHSEFVVGNDHDQLPALVSHFQDELERMGICSERELLMIGTVVLEALVNGIDHGNLELDSSLRHLEEGDRYSAAREQRMCESPYCDRRLYIDFLISTTEVVFKIRDEGPGFDHSTLVDPEDADTLLVPNNRGLSLIRTFMDEVTFNESGNEITMRLHSSEGPSALPAS